MKKILFALSVLLTPTIVLADVLGGDCFDSWGGGMMGRGLWTSFAGLGSLVWTVVGILAIVWLWKQINHKK